MRVSLYKKLSAICFLVLIGHVHGFSAQVTNLKITSILHKARHEIDNKRYASAYNMLQEYDPSSNHIDILALKIDLALHFSVRNIMDTSFAFIDLKQDKTLDEYSICPHCFDKPLVFDLQIEDILQDRLKSDPRNGTLNRLLGDYYFFVYNRSARDQKKTKNELIKQIDSLYTTAEKYGAATAASSDNHGVILLVLKNYKRAVSVLKRGLSLNKDYCNSQYNIAYAYFMIGNTTLALEKARESYACFIEAGNRADAALLTAQIYEQQGNDEQAYVYYTLSWHNGRNDYVCAKKMLLISMKLDNKQEPVKNAARLLMLDIYNLEYYNEIIDLFIAHNRTTELENFLTRLEKAFKDDPRALGNIYAGRAGISIKVYNDEKAKKEYLKKARKKYREFYPEGHEILRSIDRELK